MKIDDLIDEDVPESLRDVLGIVGMEKFIELVKVVGGTSVYFPSENNMLRAVRNRKIVEMFEGDYREVARVCGVSTNHIRKVLRVEYENKRRFNR